MFEAYNDFVGINEICEMLNMDSDKVYELLESRKIKAIYKCTDEGWKIPKQLLTEYVISTRGECYTDKNGVPESSFHSSYFQVPKVLQSKVQELLDIANIPNKCFDNPRKPYFENMAEVFLHGKLSIVLPKTEQQKMMQASLNNRGEYGKMLFEEFWSNSVLVENDMHKRVIERMELDDFLGKLTRGE